MQKQEKPKKASPLGTSKHILTIKKTIISNLGKDSDGAFRAWNRKDGK